MAKQALFILGLWLLSSSLSANVWVIVNSAHPIDQLSKRQVIDLFMGRVSVFPNRDSARTLDLPAGAPERTEFYRALTGKSEAQVDAYWATLIFAGRMSPPKQLANAQEMLAEVKANPDAIGYVSQPLAPKGVKVVMELKTQE